MIRLPDSKFRHTHCCASASSFSDDSPSSSSILRRPRLEGWTFGDIPCKFYWLPGLQDALGGGEVAHDPLRVSCERLVRHVGLPKQRQDELAAPAIGHDAQRYIDRSAAGQRDRVVEH